MSLRLHSLGALLALVVVVLGGWQHIPLLGSVQTQPGTVDIGIEHADPLALDIEYTKKDDAGLIHLRTLSLSPTFISLPAHWTRTEVRHAELADAASDAETFGYKRWTFPPGSSMGFRIPHSAPDSVIVHNPTQISLKISSMRAYLDTQITQRDIVLVKDTAIRLW